MGFPDPECTNRHYECEIQVVGRRLSRYSDGIIDYLCTITLDGIDKGWYALNHKEDDRYDDETEVNLQKLYGDDKRKKRKLFWRIPLEGIESVVRSSRESPNVFQPKDEQLRADIKFFFEDLSKPFVHPGKNGLKFL
jgi:hypothetical protein